MHRKPSAFLSMSWDEASREVRSWFRQFLGSLNVEVVEANVRPGEPLREHIEYCIKQADFVVAVLTAATPREWVDGEGGLARGMKRHLAVFRETSAEGEPVDLRSLGTIADVTQDFDLARAHLFMPAMNKVILDAVKIAEQSDIVRDLGFTISESFTEIRYLDWQPKSGAHTEVYKKHLEIKALRDGPLQVDVLSGSSQKDTLTSADIRHSHRPEIIPVGDNYHVLSRVHLEAQRGETLYLAEKSTRLGVPNKSDEGTVCVNPQLAGISGEDHGWIVMHVLYPTDRLELQIELPKQRTVVPESLQVLHDKHKRQFLVKDANIRLINSGGNLSVVRWRTTNPVPDTAYLVMWMWKT